MLVLNVIHPLVPEQLLAFLEGKQRVLVRRRGHAELHRAGAEGAGLRARDSTPRIHGKDVVAAQGEYVPEVVLGGARAIPRAATREAAARRPLTAPRRAQGAGASCGTPLPKRPPAFCTGCPERPVFSALKIAQRELGETHVAADIGCHAFATLPPFNDRQHDPGLRHERWPPRARSRRPSASGVISIMGDGGFWHNGLTAGVANAVYNKQDSVLVIAGELLHLGHRPAGQSLVGQERRAATPAGMSIAETHHGASA